MIGVSFDPGSDQQQQRQNGSAGAAPGGGVQEAIKVLSLRLPRVVGANAISPQALLSSQGSAGPGGRVESVVNQIMSRYFPQAGGEQQAPSLGGFTSQFNPVMGGSPFSGVKPPSDGGGDRGPVSGTMPIPPRRQQPSIDRRPTRTPNVVVDTPPWGHGDVNVGPDGRPNSGQPPGLIVPGPTLPSPFAPMFGDPVPDPSPYSI